MRSRILALAGAVLLLAGCTEVKDAVAGPDPEPTAGAFVEALAAQDLSGAPVADPEAAERERAEALVSEASSSISIRMVRMSPTLAARWSAGGACLPKAS